MTCYDSNLSVSSEDSCHIFSLIGCVYQHMLDGCLRINCKGSYVDPCYVLLDGGGGG